MPVRWALYHPENARTAMVATELGIWTCNGMLDDDPVWQPDNEGLANVRIDMLQIRESDNTVLAGTHGRGFYSATFNCNPTTSTSENMADNIAIYPNPTQGYTQIQVSGFEKTVVTYEILEVSGEVVNTGTKQAGSSYIRLNIHHYSRGTYFVRIKSGNQTFTKKLLKI